MIRHFLHLWLISKTFICGSVLILAIATVGCKPEETDEVALLGSQLNELLMDWEKAGRPDSFRVSDHIVSHPASYFTYTNIIRLGTNIYHCRFGARSPNFVAPGLVVITDDKIILWIRDKDAKIVVSPEKNGLRSDE